MNHTPTSATRAAGLPKQGERCAACGGRISERDRIVIAGVAVHLTCAIYRRQALRP